MCPTASFLATGGFEFSKCMHGLQACCCCCILHFMLSVLKMLLKGEVGGPALKSHGNSIVDHEKSWKYHGIVFLNFCGNPDFSSESAYTLLFTALTL